MTTANRSETAPRRDLGLDALRVLGLLLMVAIHFFQRLPSPTALTDFLNFVGESAPAFFFFAFGLTFARFRSKTALDKLEASLMLMYVGLAHNVLVADLTNVDFLFFLFLARVVIDAMSSLRNETSAYLKISIGIMLFALVVPDKGTINQMFAQTISGVFPLFPWLVFVLLGAFYSKSSRSGRRGALLGGGLILAGLIMAGLADTLGRSSLEISKWPLTTPYILLFSGINILILEGVRKIQPAIESRVWLNDPMVYLSKHLLLATVIQYYALELAYWAERHVAILQPHQDDETAVLIAIVAGSLLSLLLLFGLLPLTLRLWRVGKNTAWIESLRRHRELTAISLIGVIALLCTEQASIMVGGPTVMIVGKLSSILVMIYFALELHESQNLKRIARRGTGTPLSQA
jgi:uncharacterized membrane protein